ncbi:MAG TPA: carboxypeptidase regulatory-like domain-containing protein [Vicinamibacterales bacterium]|nr:carboxypeptidase regulatory-like domain-containing protein [Vicinamibacterales bacterium]
MRLFAVVTAVTVLAVAGRWTAAAGDPPRERQASSAGATLRGRVDIQRLAVAPERRPGVVDLATSTVPLEPEVRPAVVYLESTAVPKNSTLRAVPPKPDLARIDQRDETFVPHVLAVSVGTAVAFPNNDITFHNVFSLSKTKKFDLGRYGRGKSQTVVFDKPGVVRVFCDIHSHMSAFVLVFNHSFFTTTDADGRYRIDGIPAGSYSVTAWHEGAARDTHTVTFPPGGGAIDLDLSVR